MAALRRILSNHKQRKSHSLSDIHDTEDTDVKREVGDLRKHRPPPFSFTQSIDFPSSATDSTSISDISVASPSSSSTTLYSHRSSRRSRYRIHYEDEQIKTREKLELRRSIYDQDPLKDNYGELPLNMSQDGPDLSSTSFSTLSSKYHGESIRFRARLQHSRPVGSKIMFLILRQDINTVQGVLTEEESVVSHNMVRWAEYLHRESILYVEGRIQVPQDGQSQVKATSIHEVEVKIEKLYLVAAPSTVLPFQVEDVDRTPVELGMHVVQSHYVNQTTRLANRVLDLRTPVSHSLFRLRAGVTNAFRSYLDSRKFTEIQSSKFQETGAESGSAVFKVDYFGRPVTLAQSPQIFKQMCIAADMDRVYEIGPVFRAENSNTHRHLTEFTGLDLEMAFDNNYHEVMHLIDGMFKNIFRTMQMNYPDEIEAVKTQYPHEDLVWLDETPILKFSEGIQMLLVSGYKEDNGSDPSPSEDLSTKAEQTLGRLVKEKYHTDYYILDKFPASARPFYTMPDSENPSLSNAYDIFIRGEEVLSGSQRIHDAPLLEKKMSEAGIDPDSMKDYVNGFRWGCPPHGGGGIGLERVVMLMFQLRDIRWASLFPRDPRSFPKRRIPLVTLASYAPKNALLYGPESQTFVDEKVQDDFPPLENLIAKYGDATNTSWLDPAWTVWRDPKTGAAIGYMVHSGFGVTFGNPLCESKQLSQVVNAYIRYLHDNKLKPVWCCIDEQTQRALVHGHGWSALTAVAEERIIPSEAAENNDRNLKRKVYRAQKSGVKLFDIENFVDEHTQKEIMDRVRDWRNGRKGTQVHLTGVRPFDDMQHRRYFYARDANGRICALVVLAQLSASHGLQLKWSLEFPGAPLGAIEYILMHVIEKMSKSGMRSATFGAGAASELRRVANIGGFKVVTLEKAYNGISHTFHLGRKGDFRSKFGVHQDPLYICFPKGGLGVKGVEAIMGILQRPK